MRDITTAPPKKYYYYGTWYPATVGWDIRMQVFARRPELREPTWRKLTREQAIKLWGEDNIAFLEASAAPARVDIVYPQKTEEIK